MRFACFSILSSSSIVGNSGDSIGSGSGGSDGGDGFLFVCCQFCFCCLLKKKTSNCFVLFLFGRRVSGVNLSIVVFVGLFPALFKTIHDFFHLRP